MMTEDGNECQDDNECDLHPCGPGGKCTNLDKGRGWYCDCPAFKCNNCSCSGDLMGSQRDRSIGLGVPAISIMILCLLAYLSKNWMTVYAKPETGIPFPLPLPPLLLSLLLTHSPDDSSCLPCPVCLLALSHRLWRH